MNTDNHSNFYKRLAERTASIIARVKAAHDKSGCGVWETWTEQNVPLTEGGRADITYDGCRQCSVAIAR